MELQPNPIIYSVLEALFAPEITFGRLDRDMAEKELNLLQFASGLMAKPGTGSTEIMRSDYADAAVHSTLRERWTKSPSPRTRDLEPFRSCLWRGRDSIC